MEKIINMPITLGGAYTDEPICGGVQGEHKATAISFTPDEELSQKIQEYEAQGYKITLKIDVVTEAGELVGSEERSGEALFSPFSLTNRITASGLDCVAVARIFVCKEDVKELCKAQIKLCFIPSPVALNTDFSNDETDNLEKIAEDLLEDFAEKTKQVAEQIDKKADAVKNSAQTVARHLKQAQKIAESNEKTLIDLKEDTVFIFSGGDASSNLNTEMMVDDELSEQSKNPVENGVITREINSLKETVSEGISTTNETLTLQIDSVEEQLSNEINLTKQGLTVEINSLKSCISEEYVVEQDEFEGGWYYRKWNSGLAEMWLRTTINPEELEYDDWSKIYSVEKALPFTVKETHFVAAHINSHSDKSYVPDVLIGARVYDNSSGIILSVSALPATNYLISASVVGKWK